MLFEFLKKNLFGFFVHNSQIGVKDTPTICFLAEIWSDVIIWSFRKTSNHFWSFPVTMRSFQKKFQKLIILRFLVSELFFRNKYMLIVISIVNASKWWVTWPFSYCEFENDQFDHFIGKLIPISGLIISLSRNDYFLDQWILGFNLRYRTRHKLIIHRKSSKKL